MYVKCVMLEDIYGRGRPNAIWIAHINDALPFHDENSIS